MLLSPFLHKSSSRYVISCDVVIEIYIYIHINISRYYTSIFLWRNFLGICFSKENTLASWFRGLGETVLILTSLQDWSCRPRWQASHLRIDRLRFGFRGGPHETRWLRNSPGKRCRLLVLLKRSLFFEALK